MAITTVDGNAGPGVDGHRHVVIRRPFLPSHSQEANGFPVYAYVVP